MSPHAFVTRYGEPGGGVVFDLGVVEQQRDLIQEITYGGHFDEYDDTDDSTPVLVIEIRMMPKGHAASLPEFAGW